MRPSNPGALAAEAQASPAAARLAGATDRAGWCSLARELFGPGTALAGVETLKHSAAPAVVYRWRVIDPSGEPRALIAKQTAAGWDGDPFGHQREARFLRLLAAAGFDIPQPRVYYAGPLATSEAWLTVVEDVSAAYRFADAAQPWTATDLRPILATYAAFHARGASTLAALDDREWLFPAYRPRVESVAAELPEMVASLVAAGIWSPLPGLGALIERTLRGPEDAPGRAATLVHNDVTPANAGLPRDGRGPALLVDWEMVGSGPAELDLAYMFLQPFDNARNVDRPAALDWYWQARRGLEGRIPSPAERAASQEYADALLALWLIPVAARRLLTPFPPGSGARAYWDSMSRVLERRLGALCRL